MSIISHADEDYGTILLDADTSKFVLGYQSDDLTVFIVENMQREVKKSDFATEELYVAAVAAKHVELVDALDASGFGTDYEG